MFYPSNFYAKMPFYIAWGGKVSLTEPTGTFSTLMPSTTYVLHAERCDHAVYTYGPHDADFDIQMIQDLHKLGVI